MKSDQKTAEWLPLSEAVRVLGKSERTVQTLAARGLIAYQMIQKERQKAQRHYRRADLEVLRSQTGQAARVPNKPHVERRFIFHVKEGAISVSLPTELGEESSESCGAS